MKTFLPTINTFFILVWIVQLISSTNSTDSPSCNDESGLWVYLDWSSCVDTKYKNLQVMVSSKMKTSPNVNIVYGQVKRNATMCIEDEDFIGNLYLENNQIDQDQQSIFLNTNSKKVSMSIHSHDYDTNGKVIQTYQVLIPINNAFLGPAEVGTKQLNSNSPDDDVLSASRSSRVEVSIRYC